MINNIDELERTIEKNTILPFDEYAAIREPAVNVIINDYAIKIIEKAGVEGQKLTFEEARKIAKEEIPAAFVPEWMKNLRISANIAGTELCYLEAIKSAIERIETIMTVAFDKEIDEYYVRHANDIKREVTTNEEQ